MGVCKCVRHERVLVFRILEFPWGWLILFFSLWNLNVFISSTKGNLKIATILVSLATQMLFCYTVLL